MVRLSHKDFRRLSEWLSNLYALRDETALSQYLVSSVSSLVPGEVFSFNRIDPTRGTAWYTWAPSDYRTINDGMAILGRYARQCPLVPSLQASRGHHALRMSDCVSMAQLRRLDIYHEFYQPMQIPFTLASSLVTSPKQVVVLGLHRARKDFSERDRDVLDLALPHLSTALANARVVSGMQATLAEVNLAVDQLGQAVMGVDHQGRIRWATPRANQLLQGFFGNNPRRADRVPESLRRWMHGQERQLGDSGRLPPPQAPLVVDQGERQLVVRLLRQSDRRVLVMEERSDQLSRAALERIGLSKREAEVLGWVAQGKTNVETGIILSISARTVQKHLARVYEKLGVETRTAATARALEVM